MKKIAAFLILLMTASSYSQIELNVSYSIEAADVYKILNFEGINLIHYKFKSASIKDGFYDIKITEYRNGLAVDSTVLFLGNESEYFRIHSDQTEFDLLTKLNNKELKVGISGKSFASQKYTFELLGSSEKYAVKEFTNREGVLTSSYDKPLYLSAIITPIIKEDGSGSYCEVAQSGVEPKLLGTVYNIPHYFLISAEFYKDGQQ